MDAFKNFAIAQVVTPPAPPTTGTALTLATGQGARLPGVPFNVTVFDGTQYPTPANAEIVRVTALAGDVATLVRAQEGSTARAIVAGDYVAATMTKKFVDDVTNSSNQSAGILPDARLSPNVPRLDTANVFTGGMEVGTALRLRNPIGPVDHRLWQVSSGSDGVLYVQAFDDAGVINEVVYPMFLSRTGTVKFFGDVLEKARTTPMGHWISVPYSPGTFSSNAGPWTVDAGDVVSHAYTLIGKTLWLTFYFASTSIGAPAPTELRLMLPGGFVTAFNSILPGVLIYTGSTWVTGYVVVTAPNNVISVRLDVAGTVPFQVATNVIQVSGAVCIPLQ